MINVLNFINSISNILRNTNPSVKEIKTQCWCNEMVAAQGWIRSTTWLRHLAAWAGCSTADVVFLFACSAIGFYHFHYVHSAALSIFMLCGLEPGGCGCRWTREQCQSRDRTAHATSTAAQSTHCHDCHSPTVRRRQKNNCLTHWTAHPPPAWRALRPWPPDLRWWKLSALCQDQLSSPLRALGLLLADGAPTVGRGEDFMMRWPGWNKKVKKSIPRWEMNRLSEGYKRAVNQNWKKNMAAKDKK